MPRKNAKSIVPADPQKSSAAQFLAYVASTGAEVYLGRTRFDSPCDILPFRDR